jgi:transcriptional regulator with XRE-family HTH domain
MEESSARASDTRDVNSRIAKRVRELRAQLGLSLDALAGRSGVSRSMLSLIERGESSPTAVVLEKVATGLNIPLAALFDDASAPPVPVARRAERTSWRDPQTGYIRRNISPPNWPSPFQIVDVILPAGARVAYETAGREVAIHQQIWMREGAIEVTVGNVVHQLSEDDCLAMQLSEPITFRNRTRRSAAYVAVVAAEYAHPLRR